MISTSSVSSVHVFPYDIIDDVTSSLCSQRRVLGRSTRVSKAAVDPRPYGISISRDVLFLVVRFLGIAVRLIKALGYSSTTVLTYTPPKVNTEH